MVVKVSKPELNLREKISELDKPSGIAGEAMLRAETPQEQFNLISAGRRNLIINGDMKVAQRGTSFTSHSGYTLDRYKGFGHTYNQIDNGDFYSLRMLWVTGTDANIYHPVELERGELENGQTYTLSFKYKSAGALMTLECFYRDSTAGSNVVSQIPVQTLSNSSEFTDYSITFTCSGRISAHGALNIRFGNSSGTKEIAKLQLVAHLQWLVKKRGILYPNTKPIRRKNLEEVGKRVNIRLTSSIIHLAAVQISGKSLKN